jgi:hypothetical protein
MGYTDKWRLLESCAAVERSELILLKQARIAILMTAGVLSAAPLHIGMITADGRLWVDSAGVSNHATIFEGSVVETEEVPAKLRLASGAAVWLDVASRADVFQDHLLLQKGRAQLDGGLAFRIEAGTLRVALASPGSRAMVSMRDSGAVQVGALNGAVQVRNAQDVMVAQVDPGRPVELRPDSDGASLVTGCVSKLGKSMVLQDEVSGVTVELRGKGLNNYLGKRIQVTGAAVGSGATAAAQQVIQASALKVLGTGCAASLAASTGAAATGSRNRPAAVSPGAASGASGASTGISVPAAVLGGVGVAAASAAAVHAITAKKLKPPISAGR